MLQFFSTWAGLTMMSSWQVRPVPQDSFSANGGNDDVSTELWLLLSMLTSTILRS